MAVSPRRAAALALAFTIAATTARAQTVHVEGDATAGYSKYSDERVSAVAAQLRSFGELNGGLQFFVEGVWAARSDDESDAFGAAYPYGNRVEVMEAYAERLFRGKRALVGFRAGRYRTPFGIYTRGDYAYSGLLRAPLIRYGTYFGLSNTSLEHGVDVIAGIPQLTIESSVSAPADVGAARRRSGFDSVTRVQAFHGPLLVGFSHSRTNPFQPETFARGRARFNGADFRWMQSGVQLSGEYLDGRPFDGPTTSGWHFDASVHRPVMGPVTAVARIEKLDYETVPQFTLRATRQTVGARVRILQNLAAQLDVMHERETGEAEYTSVDVAVTYSLRIR
jgi:hypothetical protein